MDNVESVSEVQRSIGDVSALRDNTTTLKLLEIDSLAKIGEIIRRYEALNIPKEHAQVFTQTLMYDRNAWFLEAGEEGLVYFTQVVPRISAQFNVLFWDGKLPKTRLELVHQSLRMAFERFELARISAQFKWSNAPLKRFLKEAGFVYEGTLRKGWLDPHGFEDMLLYGIISEEM